MLSNKLSMTDIALAIATFVQAIVKDGRLCNAEVLFAKNMNPCLPRICLPQYTITASAFMKGSYVRVSLVRNSSYV